MLRSIVNKALSGRRGTAAPTGRRTTGTPGTTAGTGSANSEIAKGAGSLLKGLSRKRKGL